MSPARGLRHPGALALGLAAVGAGLVVAALMVARGGQLSGGEPVPPSTALARLLPVARYRIEPAGRPAMEARLEVAADPASRELGLQARDAVPRWTGMVFLFPADTDVAFWMKGTRVALDIAFVAADGRVVRVERMVPCRADPCPLYRAGGAYRYAVELGAGALAAAGVRAGARIVPLEPDRLPKPE